MEEPLSARPPAQAPVHASAGSSSRRYALVGAGSRASMYLGALAGDHAADGELVAIGDTNPGRLDVHTRRLLAAGAPGAPVWPGVP